MHWLPPWVLPQNGLILTAFSALSHIVLKTSPASDQAPRLRPFDSQPQLIPRSPPQPHSRTRPGGDYYPLPRSSPTSTPRTSPTTADPTAPTPRAAGPVPVSLRQFPHAATITASVPASARLSLEIPNLTPLRDPNNRLVITLPTGESAGTPVAAGRQLFRLRPLQRKQTTMSLRNTPRRRRLTQQNPGP
jgi:hypothetical protein